MTYNRFLYNTALYNAGREEVGAITRSIIQAHTGPHIQAVIGSTAGVSLISDFIIQEGTLVKPPSSFKFPDLRARMRAVFPGQPPYTDRLPDLPASIHGFGFRDLGGRISPSDRIPNLGGSIFGFLEATLSALITGQLGEHDLAGSIFGTGKDLPAVLNLLLAGSTTPFAPSLGARLAVQPSSNLGAMIYTPLDLPAFLAAVNAGDLPAAIQPLAFSLLAGRMLGVPAPQLSGFLRAFETGTSDLPASTRSSLPGDGDLDVTINPVFTGETGYAVGLLAAIEDTETYGITHIPGFIRGVTPSSALLSAIIKTGGDSDLTATIQFLGALNLPAFIGTIPFGDKNRELPAFLQSVNSSDLAAVMTINSNVSFLSASISSLRDTADLNAFIRVAETFVTAIMNISTMSSANIRAVIGSPGCGGGTGIHNLSATATPQFVGNLGASLESFIETDLGATINSTGTFHSIDSIPISFTTTKFRTPSLFQACDQLEVTFAPFRGANLGASISGVLLGADIGGLITATFPLLRVVPSISRLTAADISNLDEFGLQEIRLQLEGSLTEFFYVTGTDRTFSRDASNNWKINIRSFRPIADNLFGEFASARICRLGALTNFATLDQAVRFCIQAVIGLNDEANLGASITSVGQFVQLPANLTVNNYFHDLTGSVFPTTNPSSIGASITSLNAILKAFIHPVGVPGTSDLSASIAQQSVNNLGGSVTGAFAVGSTGAGTGFLGAVIPHVLQVSSLSSAIAANLKTESLKLSGIEGEYLEGPSLSELGWSPGSKLTVAVWIQHTGAPVANEAILGNYSDADSRTSGFGLRWFSDTEVEFFINGTSNRARVYTEYPQTWQFIAGVYDPTLVSDNIKIYSNPGLPGATFDNYTFDVGNVSEPIFVGKTSNVKSGAGEELHSNFHLHELMIWGGALDAIEIQEIAALPMGKIYKVSPSGDVNNYISSDDLLLHWDMEDLNLTTPEIVPVNSAITASGTLVGLDASDIVSDFSPSFSVGAVDLGGSTFWVQPFAANLPFSVGYTGSATVWAVCSFDTGGASAVWGLGNSSASTGIPFGLIKLSSPDVLTLSCNDAALTEYTITGPTVVFDNSVWYTVVATYDAPTKTLSLHVNGIDYGSVVLATTRQSTDQVAVGAYYDGAVDFGSPHRGKLEALGFWDRVLTSDERDVLLDLTEEPMFIGHATLADNLTAWYRPGEAQDAGNFMTDMSDQMNWLFRVGPAADWLFQTYVE